MYSIDLLRKYSSEARKWDEWYAALYGLQIYQSAAVRVEQGEYGVVSKEKALGTYNVRQCVVLYLANEKMHGLAHIDGHTEIKSLNRYFDDLNIQRGQVPHGIKIIGARSTTTMGLNDSNANIAKVTSFLQEFFKGSGIDISNISQERQEIVDFVIDGSGTFYERYLVRGEYSKEQALHTIQEIKRKDGYLGSYPIARANDGSNQCVFLDERAIVKLNEYLKNVAKDKPRDPMDIYNYEAFDAAIPVILEEWENNVLHLNCTRSTPLFIGDHATNQRGLIDCQKYANSANIDLVLGYCSTVDNELNIQQVKNCLVGQNGVGIDCGIFAFDAVVNAKKLLETVSVRSSKLKKLLMLNAQGACDLDQKPCTISTIKEVLGQEELNSLEEIIATLNNKDTMLGLNKLTIEEHNEQISIQFQHRGKPLSRKEKLILSHKTCSNDEKIQSFCDQKLLDYNQVRNSVEES